MMAKLRERIQRCKHLHELRRIPKEHSGEEPEWTEDEVPEIERYDGVLLESRKIHPDEVFHVDDVQS